MIKIAQFLIFFVLLTIFIPNIVLTKDISPEEQKKLEDITKSVVKMQPTTPVQAPPKWTEAEFRFKQEDHKVIILIGLMVLTFLTLMVVLYGMSRTSSFTATNIVHATGLVLIIFATICVIMVAEVDEQFTAAIGILGAVAGYLFGTTTRRASTEPPSNDT